MGKRLDLAGKKIGCLTAIRHAPSRKMKSGAIVGYWVVRCDCGKEKEMSVQGFNLHPHASCGKGCALRWDAVKTVSCEKCGNEYEIQIGSIKKNKGASKRICKVCSAKFASDAAKSRPASNRLPDGVAAFNSLFGAYKRSAKIRGVEFSLTEDEFRELTQDNCHYCGSPPKTIRHGDALRSKGKPSGTYIYNGIDRVDSDQGYYFLNCVPCCKVCNFMKRDLDYSDFLNHIKKILKQRSIFFEHNRD